MLVRRRGRRADQKWETSCPSRELENASQIYNIITARFSWKPKSVMSRAMEFYGHAWEANVAFSRSQKPGPAASYDGHEQSHQDTRKAGADRSEGR